MELDGVIVDDDVERYAACYRWADSQCRAKLADGDFLQGIFNVCRANSLHELCFGYEPLRNDTLFFDPSESAFSEFLAHPLLVHWQIEQSNVDAILIETDAILRDEAMLASAQQLDS